MSYIDAYAFRGCRSLTSVTLGTGLRTIQTGAFQGCAITTISIPALVTTLSQSAFRDCSALTAINVDGDNTNYSSADGVLFDKNKTVLMQYPAAKSGTSYTIPNNVVTVYDSSFQKCALLTSVVIPDSVTTLGAAAFNSCASLTSITIGSAVSSIGGVGLYDPSPFGGCTSLAEFIVSENNEYFSSADGVLLSKDGSTLFEYPMGKTGTSYTIPDSVTAIHEYAFASCTGLTSITIGNNVESIGNYAFDSCASLMSISIPDSVTSIGDGAFFYCESLTSITIGSAVSSIGTETFYGCSSVTVIELQSVPASIGQDAFSLRTSSPSVTCTVYSPNNIANGVLDDYKGDYTTLVYLVPGEYADGDWTYKLEEFGDVQKAIITGYIGHDNCIIIPSTVGTSGNSGGGGSGGGGDEIQITKSAVIEPIEPVEPVEPIESTEYTVVQLGSGSSSVFQASSVQSLTIPDTVKIIANGGCQYATYGAGQIAYLRIEGNVESIGNNAFAGCTGLKEIQFMGSIPCDNIASNAFSLGSPALGTANCTIYSPNNWAQDKINNSIYGTLTFKTLDTTRRYNPLPKLRYSYAEGTIPDFSVDFSVTMNENYSFIVTVGNQVLYIPLEDTEQTIQENPSYPSIMMAYIFACEDKVVTMTEAFGMLTVNDDHTLSLSETGGDSGNISCENGTITLTLRYYGGTETITFDAPEWCFYPDENGEYGWYDLTMFGSGLYVDESPICPACLYWDSTSNNLLIFYQDGYISLNEEPLAEPPTLVKTVVNDVMTDVHWISDGDIYPTGVYLAPFSIPGNAPTELPPLEIPITYDSATRRISVPKGYDMYGGATTDVNSVKLVFSGIVPAGENFIARVDFAVPVKVDEYTIERPFILLEQNEDEWSAMIPNAVLAATRDTHKLPLQLILANDSQIVNSRNTIILETSLGIESAIPGNELPTYEMPEWPLPTGVSESIDVHTVNVTYNPATRILTTSRDPYGGATIDTLSVRINVTGIEPIGTDFGARLDFAAPIRVDEESVIKPFVVLEQIGTAYSAMIPQAVLMAAKETKKLPFQLVTRHGDIIVNSRNTIVLEITRAINAMETVEQAYTPYVMYRNDTWEWLPDYTYGVGAVVLYDGKLFASTAPNNLGNAPFKGSEYWTMVQRPVYREALQCLRAEYACGRGSGQIRRGPG